MGTSNSPRISKINIIQKWTELSEKEMRTARKSARREFWLEWKFHFQQKWSSNINYNFRCLQKYYLIYFIYFTFIFNEFIYVKLYFPRGGRKWSILAVQSELKPFSYPFLKKFNSDIFTHFLLFCIVENPSKTCIKINAQQKIPSEREVQHHARNCLHCLQCLHCFYRSLCLHCFNRIGAKRLFGLDTP